MKKIKLKPFIWVNVLFVLYTVVHLFWSDLIYKNDNLENIYFNIGIAAFLIIPYSIINSKVNLDDWYLLFLVPFLPYLLYQVLLSPIWYTFFYDPYTNDDLGVGIQSIIVGFIHWISIVISIFLGYVIKGYKSG
jgi:hypothetical protein